jgi:hypothetical protein
VGAKKEDAMRIQRHSVKRTHNGFVYYLVVLFYPPTYHKYWDNQPANEIKFQVWVEKDGRIVYKTHVVDYECDVLDDGFKLLVGDDHHGIGITEYALEKDLRLDDYEHILCKKD